MTRQRGARIRVTTLATTAHTPWSECEDCDYARTPDGQSWQATRAAARRHAAHYSHTVHAGYAVIYAFGVTVTRPEA
jgi:hypothetical protein